MLEFYWSKKINSGKFGIATKPTTKLATWLCTTEQNFGNSHKAAPSNNRHKGFSNFRGQQQHAFADVVSVGSTIEDSLDFQFS